MDLVSGSFLTAIIIAGGLIALLADWLGRTIGKKRLRLFHIRPRHTAAIFTLLAGMLIPFATILVIAAVSEDARQWILQGSAAIEDAKRLTKERNSLLEDVDRTRKEVRSLQVERQRARQQLNDFSSRNKDLSKRADKLTKDVESARRGYQESLVSLKRTSSELRSNLRLLGSARLDVNQKAKLVSSLDTKLKQASTQLSDMNSRTEKLVREIDLLERDIKERESFITGLETSERNLRISVGNFEKENAAIQEQLSTARKDLAETRSLLQTGQEELKDLQGQIQILKAISDNSRTQPLVYMKGDEVARITVPANMATSAARNQVTRLLRVARIGAEQKGARGAPAAGFFTRDMESGPVSPDQQASLLVAQIAGYPEERVLVAKSLINSFRGEPCALEVDLYPNKLVFAAREVIAETRIDSALPIAEVIRRVGNLMTGPVRERALSLGMVPKAGRENTLGEVDPDEVYAIVQSIKAEQRTARLQVLAAKEIKAGDPLEIEFRIR